MNEFDVGDRVGCLNKMYRNVYSGFVEAVRNEPLLQEYHYRVRTDDNTLLFVPEKHLYNSIDFKSVSEPTISQEVKTNKVEPEHREKEVQAKIKDAIKKVIFSGNRTIIIWDDGTKTIVKCSDDEEFDKYAGFSAAIVKALFGSTFAAQNFLKSVEEDHNKGEDDE